MRKSLVLLFCSLVLFPPNTFAECAWLLWKSTSFLNLAALPMVLDRKLSPEEINVEKWEYLNGFQNQKECQLARSENIRKLLSAQKALLKKNIEGEKVKEAASKDLQLSLDKRFPAFEGYIATQRIFGRDDKEIETLILQQIEKKKKIDTPSEVLLSEDEAVRVDGKTFEFKCIPDTIDPRFKG